MIAQTGAGAPASDTMDLTTPALLFPAISLLLLAYTSRFLALAGLTRTLHAEWLSSGSPVAELQIRSLRARLGMIRLMQLLGVVAFSLCALSMFLLLLERGLAGRVVFGASLLVLLASLFVSLREITLSNRALEIQLEDMSARDEAS
jgi:hypothetical protein